MDYRCQTITQTTRIAKNATVIGDVRLGEDVSIFFGATLRGDIGNHVQVGDRTNVQELVCVHVPVDGDTIIGSDVTIGHGAIIHGCTIGDGSLIGMGSIILDGAKIGKHCLVGAGALVTGSADIEDGMLVTGFPARAIRPLTEEEIEGLELNIKEYIEISKDLVSQGMMLEGELPQC